MQKNIFEKDRYIQIIMQVDRQAKREFLKSFRK